VALASAAAWKRGAKKSYAGRDLFHRLARRWCHKVRNQIRAFWVEGCHGLDFRQQVDRGALNARYSASGVGIHSGLRTRIGGPPVAAAPGLGCPHPHPRPFSIRF